MLKLFLFGTPLCQQDGHTIHLPRRKCLALLAYLALNPQAHSREALAALLYPDAPNAHTYLRRTLSEIRQALGDDILLAENEVQPAADRLWVDVLEFEKLVKIDQLSITNLQTAVSLYTADFMTGFTLPDAPEFDEWQFFQREGLRQSLAMALQQLIDWHVSQKMWAQGIEYGRHWLSLDPLHEPAHRRLMQLYAWDNQHVAAQRQFETCRHLLHEELGIDPEAETLVLYEVIKTRQLASDTATPRYRTSSTRSFAPADQEIHFAYSADGTRIAYAVVGQGPPLVKVANPLTHLQYDWGSPIWQHWIEALSRHFTLIRYDERGCGLSDRQVSNFSTQAWVNDLEAVVDDLGLTHFPIFGMSHGPSVAVAYAVRHPERVSHLICFGAYARGRFHRPLTPAQQEEAEMLLSMVRVGWGQDNPAFRQVFATLFVPEGTPEQHNWFTELARVTAYAEKAAQMEQAFFDIDVSDLATQMHCPTLVLHSRGDQMVPFAEGRLLADLIPQARFVPLESNNHVLLAHEPAWPHFLHEVYQFLGIF
jgi:DNA-binding SARP family transcriptional activator/pimeloyl-ACP methyl ester carboxylesterase